LAGAPSAGNGPPSDNPELPHGLLHILAVLSLVREGKARPAERIHFCFGSHVDFFTPYLLTETLAAFLIILVAFSLAKYFLQGSLNHLLPSAFLCAAAMFVRPICYYLPVFLAIALLAYRVIKGPPVKRFMAHISLFLCFAMVPAIGWQVRNYLATGYTGFSAIAAVTLYYFNSVAVLARQTQVSYTDLQDDKGLNNIERGFAHHPEQRSWTEAQRFDFMAKEGLKVIRDNLFSYGVIQLKTMFRFMFDPGIIKFFKLFRYQSDNYQFTSALFGTGLLGTVNMMFSQKPAMFFSYVLSGLFLGAVIFSACAAFVSKSMQFNLPVYALLTLIVYFWVLSGINDCPRFRMPTMPLIAVFSGIGAYLLSVKTTAMISR
jgi:hypothetical protein